MYHYRRLLTDTETILASIDSLQAATQGNERYFERLKNLFIDDNYDIFWNKGLFVLSELHTMGGVFRPSHLS